VAVGDEQPLGRGAPARERGPQPPRHRQSEFVLAAGVDGRQLFELGRDGNRIENFGFGRNLIGQGQHGTIGIAEGRWRVTGGAASHPRRRAQANVLLAWANKRR
jgi:hypothetical protein